MLGNEAQANTPKEALRSADYSAGANNGPFVDASNLEGDIEFVYNVGVVTGGSVVFKLQDATDSGGTGAADISPAIASASINTAGTTGKLIIRKSKVRSHVRLVATVTTGPVQCAGVALARDKTTA